MSYAPLRIVTIKPEKTLTFDLFIHYKNQYLKYAEKGKNLNFDRLGKLKKQNIARFFIHATEETFYQKFLDEILDETLSNPTISSFEKANIIEGAAGTAVERMKEDPGNKVSYSMTEKAAGSLRELINTNPEALKLIFGKKVEQDNVIVKHSLNVSILATQLAQISKCKDAHIDDIATAALIHDIGLLQLPGGGHNLFIKKSSEFTPEEKGLYNTHAEKTAQLLQGKSYVNENITNLILHHEEKLSGKGPLGITKLGKLEEILSLSDCFEKRISAENMSPKSALKEFMLDELGNYNLELMNLFKKIVKKLGVETLAA